jgi:hypothetical protein
MRGSRGHAAVEAMLLGAGDPGGFAGIKNVPIDLGGKLAGATHISMI